MPEIKPEWIATLRTLRMQLAKGDQATQEQLDALSQAWKARKDLLLPGEKEERFTLVDGAGNPKPLTAPRWLCHLLGLRHRSAHILLRWQSPGLGRLLLLQVRSWSKTDSPGHLDISVGGHVVGDTAPEKTAYQELKEELGVTRADLKGGRLIYCTGYESTPEPETDSLFHNVEWCDVYAGELTTEGFLNMNFEDNEVVGLYLCPELEALNLLEQERIPLASALKNSLRPCL